MPFFTAQLKSAAALADATAFASLVPGAAANFHITNLTLGCNTGAAALQDFDILIGLNRGTARGTSTGTATVAKNDPNSAASVITAVDTTWSAAPTLSASDDRTFPFNTRGGFAQNFDLKDILSDIGTAKPLVLVNRSGANLPTGHSVTVTVQWLE